jgi:hypothetical protein
MANYLQFTRPTKCVSGVMAENMKVLQARVVGDAVDKEAPRA